MYLRVVNLRPRTQETVLITRKLGTKVGRYLDAKVFLRR